MEQMGSSSVSSIPAAQLGALLLELYPRAAEPDAPDAGGLLEWLSGHIAFDAAWFGRSVLEAGLLRPEGGHTHGLAPGFVADWCRVRHLDPMVPAALAHLGHGVAMTAQELPQAASMRAFAADHRIDNALSVIVHAPDSPWWMHLSLYGRDAAFGARERALLELLMPHLVSAQGLRLRDAAAPVPDGLALLSRREAEVARLFGEGHSYKMVARTLGSSPATVRHHLRQVYAKLGITSKVQMARLVCGQAAQV
ncbi:response regulator transcription factor [Acidovorax cavernicola]|nr:helix-turn-helix transcriptional regulator [Acidovorax cavernicola]